MIVSSGHYGDQVIPLPPRPPAFDVAVATGLLIAGLVEAATSDVSTSPEVHVLITVAVTGALVWRRSVPLFAVTVALAGILSGGRPDTPFSLFAAIVIATYTCGLVLDARWSLIGLAVAVVPPFVGIALDDPQPADLVAIAVLYGGAWAAGRLVHIQTDRADRLAVRTAELETGDAERRAEAAAEERARIARELHDVISHSISVITVQTQAVRKRLGPEHRREADDLQAVENTARQAMVELRRLFGVLRSDGERAPLAPQPGLDQLPRLLERVRATGADVEVEVSGDLLPLSPGVDLTAYRIVQECLTNTIKHSGGAAAVVRLTYGRDDLLIEVTDDGQAPSGTGAGHGLVGMQERVTLYGGWLDHGPATGGGFVVRAWLPLGEGRR